MSKFNHYAQELNEIAKTSFKAYKDAEEKMKRAEEAMKGLSPVTVEGARAKANYLEAQEELKTVQKGLGSNNENVRALRNSLVNAVQADDMADPSKLDTATLELLKSGILKPNEYIHLYEQAQSNNNKTMVRLIGKYAGEAAESADGDNSIMLKHIARESQNGAHDQIEAMDAMINIMDRTANNPYMIDHWEELTDSIIEAF